MALGIKKGGKMKTVKSEKESEESIFGKIAGFDVLFLTSLYKLRVATFPLVEASYIRASTWHLHRTSFRHSRSL